VADVRWLPYAGRAVFDLLADEGHGLMTTDRNDPGLREIITEGPRKVQQKDYLVLSDEERKKGFVRPVLRSYIHLKCGVETTMGYALAETYAANPKFYGGTFCCGFRTHFPLQTEDGHAFEWSQDGTPVGSSAEEAKEFLDKIAAENAKREAGGGI
jgi:hypothetical protein